MSGRWGIRYSDGQRQLDGLTASFRFRTRFGARREARRTIRARTVDDTTGTAPTFGLIETDDGAFGGEVTA